MIIIWGSDIDIYAGGEGYTDYVETVYDAPSPHSRANSNIISPDNPHSSSAGYDQDPSINPHLHGEVLGGKADGVTQDLVVSGDFFIGGDSGDLGYITPSNPHA
jgi:hypothetical protein